MFVDSDVSYGSMLFFLKFLITRQIALSSQPDYTLLAATCLLLPFLSFLLWLTIEQVIEIK